MVKSDKMYNFQSYLELVTGQTHIRQEKSNDFEKIHEILTNEGLQDELWDFPISEINYVLEEEFDVVLVEVLVWNEDTQSDDKFYRWYQVEKEENEDLN